jgi:hypothetical protein
MSKSKQDARSDERSIRLSPHFEISFQRTLRIPDDGREYPLPPGLGEFPVCRVADYAGRVPEAWRERGGLRPGGVAQVE